jgi:hypothetical protein
MPRLYTPHGFVSPYSPYGVPSHTGFAATPGRAAPLAVPCFPTGRTTGLPRLGGVTRRTARGERNLTSDRRVLNVTDLPHLALSYFQYTLGRADLAPHYTLLAHERTRPDERRLVS